MAALDLSLKKISRKPWFIALFIFTLLLTAFQLSFLVQADTENFDSIGDSNLKPGVPNQNFGSETIMDINNDRDGIVRFNLSSIPAGSTVTSATLTLVVTAINGSNERRYSVHRVLVDWDESTVTWNNPGSTPGTHFASSPTATVTLSAVGTYNWNVTSDVSSFIAGTATNYGWRIIWTSNVSGTLTQIDIGTKENTTPSNRPTLSVTYTPPGDTTPPTISSIKATNITSSTATITWKTNEKATSRVDYGKTKSYGKSKFSNTLVKNHSIKLTGLSADTLYHYRVRSKDTANNEKISGDKTFRTAKAPLPPEEAETQIPGTPTVEAPEIPGDRTPPKVTLAPPSPNPTKSATTKFSGSATEETGIVSALQYSLNGGISWHPIKEIKGLGKKKASFTFTTPPLEDGNYKVVVRAMDNSDNTGLSPTRVLVVDVLPPLVGGHIATLGPQVLIPDKQGLVTAVVGSEQRIILSAVGGPTKVEIILGEEKFPLTYSPDTRLWSGNVRFSEGGVHDLRVAAQDGARNKIARFLGGVSVQPGGEVLDAGTGEPIEKAEVYLYFFEEMTKSWVLWDAPSFGLKNPYLTDEKGQYSFFVPPGRYYLSARASGYRTVTSEIVELGRGSLLGYIFHLPPRPHLTIPFFGTTIYLPSFLDLLVVSREEPISPLVAAPEPRTLEIGGKIPSFSLVNLKGKRISSKDLKGKVLLTFGSVWSPTFSEQAPILSALAKKEASFYVIFLQEKASAVETFLKRGGYSFPSLIDKKGTLVKSYKVLALPQHFFIDRGVIRMIEMGVLGETKFLEFFK